MAVRLFFIGLIISATLSAQNSFIQEQRLNPRVDIAFKQKEDSLKVLADKIVNGQTFLTTQAYGDVPLLIFGEHNMKNISGALAVCE